MVLQSFQKEVGPGQVYGTTSRKKGHCGGESVSGDNEEEGSFEKGHISFT